ncbi:DUF2271 domain-containing protein [Siculibacillus lacustris]|uniref:DUF2271 domain-containing protein n=1 Tax=Siculibacillus lacustris TaxID=1549641 RepID=A0A4Q9VG04_9HYPH|nr:DUF2271 domain-containing protein [Siculibacillus lacustris]TBW33784.1 DUF2271 domain-containing protein [Siculibacillus lacustris]
MKIVLPALAIGAAFLAPIAAEAKQVTVQTTMKAYGGSGAYAVLWVGDAGGKYKGTLWLAGDRAKYWRHLADWQRASGGRPAEVDGITGASIGSGRTLKITVDIADALIDAGYQLHVDTAVEDGREVPADAVVPLSTDQAGKPVVGKGYVKSLLVTF